MDQTTTYKYVSIALAIIALVFAFLYFTKPEATVGDIYESVGGNVTACNDALADWEATYGAQASSTEKQNALEDAIADCTEELTEGEGRLE